MYEWHRCRCPPVGGTLCWCSHVVAFSVGIHPWWHHVLVSTSGGTMCWCPPAVAPSAGVHQWWHHLLVSTRGWHPLLVPNRRASNGTSRRVALHTVTLVSAKRCTLWHLPVQCCAHCEAGIIILCQLWHLTVTQPCKLWEW